MSAGHLVGASGMVQATFGVLLGWVMAGFSSGRTERLAIVLSSFIAATTGWVWATASYLLR